MTELVFDNVGKLFTRADKNGLTHAISDVSFKAKEKEFVSIVGPSGCGKSTMLRLIAGLIGPSFGEITLDGENHRAKEQQGHGVSKANTISLANS